MPETAEDPADRSMDRISDQLNRSVEEPELSVRSRNCLKKEILHGMGLALLHQARFAKPDAHDRLVAPPPPPPRSIPEELPDGE